MRTSKQKNLILKIINTSYTHPTALDIYKLCQKEIPNISLGTVYRNLNYLVDMNEIQKIKMPDNIAKYDHIGKKHAHFICLKCNGIFDVEQKLLEVSIKDYKIVDYEINFKGVCSKCLKEEEK